MDQDRPVTAVTGQSLRSFSTERVKRMLGGGLLVDGTAATVLAALGFGRQLGVAIGDSRGRYDAGVTAERDDWQPGQDPVNHSYTSLVTVFGSGHQYYPLTLTAGARQVSTLVDADRQDVSPAMVLYENELGGRVAIYPFDLSGGPADSDTNLLNRAIYDNEIFYRETTMRHDLSYKQEGGTLRHTLLLGVALSFYKEREVLGDRVHREGTPEAADADALKIDIYDPEPYYGLTIPQDFALFRNREREETSWGMYLQDLVELGDQWVLLGGLRYDGVDFDERTNQRGSYRTHDRSDGSLSPRLGVVYKPVGGFSLFSSYSRSFRPKSGEKILDEPEDDATPITPDMVGPVDPELAAQLEVGGRWTDADNRLSATLALYDLARTNVVETNPRYRIYRVQIGRQHSRGLDLDLTAQPIPQLRAIASYAYVDASIEKDADRPEWEDNHLDNTPEHSASLWSNYRHTSGLAVGLGVVYTGERQGNLDNDFILDDYVRVDATLTYRLQTLRRVASPEWERIPQCSATEGPGHFQHRPTGRAHPGRHAGKHLALRGGAVEAHLQLQGGSNLCRRWSHRPHTGQQRPLRHRGPGRDLDGADRRERNHGGSSRSRSRQLQPVGSGPAHRQGPLRPRG